MAPLINVIYTVALLDMISASMITTLLSTYLKEFVGLSASVSGLVLSIYGIVQFGSSPVVGGMSDLFGHKNVLALSLLICSFSYSLLADPWLVAIFVSRVLAGIFKHTQNQCKTLASSVVSTEEEKLKVFGRLNSMGNVAFIFAPTIGGFVIGRFGFPAFFLLTGAVWFLCSILVYFLLPADCGEIISKDQKKKDGNNNSKGLIALVKEVNWTNHWDLMLLRFLQSFVVLLYRTSFNWAMSEKFHATSETIGYLTSLQGFTSFCAAYYIGPFVRWYGRDRVTVFIQASLLMSLAYGFLYLAPNLLWYSIGLIVLCFCTSMLRVLNLDLSVERSDKHDVGLMIGVAASVVSGSRAICPVIGGVLHDFNADLPAIASCAISLLSFYVTFRYTAENQRKFARKKME